MVDTEHRVCDQDETLAEMPALSPALLNEVRDWLGEQLGRFAFSDITISLTVHESKITKVQRSVTEKNLQRLRQSAAPGVEHATANSSQEK